MNKYGIIKLSLVEALTACCRGGRVYLLDMDEFEEVKEVRYMTIEDIVETDRCHTVLFFEIVPEENNDR